LRKRVIERQAQRCTYFTFEQLDGVAGLKHAVFGRSGGFSTPPYGGLNLVTSTGDDPVHVGRNRALVSAVLGLPLVSARAVHGAEVLVIGREDILAASDPFDPWQERLRQWLRPQQADAVVTDVPGFALFWAFGDCAPILLYDRAHHVIALIHAGWRGAAQGIIPRTIAVMGERYGTQPANLLAAIGPAIGACCYEVSKEVRAAFQSHPIAGPSACFEEAADARLFLDVARSNEGQLLAAGLPRDQIETSGFCTGCRTDLFYSHRREPKPSGRFGVGIGLA
jgi:YfiH family protein